MTSWGCMDTEKIGLYQSLEIKGELQLFMEK